jgi:PIN domain nuclease of toxin-antitoxin system
VTYLDTHVVVWLYRGDLDLLSRPARDEIQNQDLLISPMVLLELEYLHEIGRLKPRASQVLAALANETALAVCRLPFSAVVQDALNEKWARDPFDRLIVAQARANGASLVTRDEKIRRYYKRAVW